MRTKSAAGDDLAARHIAPARGSAHISRPAPRSKRSRESAPLVERAIRSATRVQTRAPPLRNFYAAFVGQVGNGAEALQMLRCVIRRRDHQKDQPHAFLVGGIPDALRSAVRIQADPERAATVDAPRIVAGKLSTLPFTPVGRRTRR